MVEMCVFSFHSNVNVHCVPPGRVTSAGYTFISAEYRLIPPSTAHDIVQDIQDLFTFLSNALNDTLDEKAPEAGFPTFHIDTNNIAVAGSSAGGLCAFLAAMHAKPKPKVVIAEYAMGGDFLVCLSTSFLQYLT
jgi:hypothetical protein